MVTLASRIVAAIIAISVGVANMKTLLDHWEYLAVAVMFAIVLAVADMNWPDHMGGGGHVLSALGIL